MNNSLYFTGILFLIALVISQSLASDSLPPELENCGAIRLSFEDLKYYSESELSDGYCKCKKHEDIYKELIALTQAQSMPTRDDFNRGDDYSAAVLITSSNADKIQRVLKNDFRRNTLPSCSYNQ